VIRRPFLTARVLRGLKRLVAIGWDRIDANELSFSSHEEQDLFCATRWLDRMAPFAEQLRAKKRAYRRTRSAA
jgi:hypothetical protein